MTAKTSGNERIPEGIAAILACSTYGDAAKRLGISESRLRVWRKDPAFVEAMRDARREIQGEVATKLVSLAGKAAAVLESVLDGEDDATNAEKMTAARTVLERARDFAGDADVAEQIAELTEIVKGRTA